MQDTGWYQQTWVIQCHIKCLLHLDAINWHRKLSLICARWWCGRTNNQLWLNWVDVAGGQKLYTVSRLSHDEKCKFQTEPNQDIQASRLRQDWGMKNHVSRQDLSRDSIIKYIRPIHFIGSSTRFYHIKTCQYGRTHTDDKLIPR